MKKNPNLTFGKNLLTDFYIDPTYININHGSYGYSPKVVYAAKRKYQQQVQHNTEKWFRFDAEKKINQVRQIVANRVNAKMGNIFLVQNASDGFNSFLKSIKWQQGDVVAIHNTEYLMGKKTMEVLVEKYKIKLFYINLTLQDHQSIQSLLLKIQNSINNFEGKIKLALCDHIVSSPAVIFPVKQIAAFYHQKGIPIFIDGAHAIGQTDVDMSNIQPDGYISNFHKWNFATKSAAFLYISDAFIGTTHPNITGNFYGQGIARQYFWTGTRDYTAYASIPDALKYYDSFGPGAVREYNHQLILKAQKRLAEIWGTRRFTTDERMIGFLGNVQMPSNDFNLCVQIGNQILQQLNCYIFIYQFDGKVWSRLSGQIYNELSDYEFAATKFLEILQNRLSKKEQKK